MDPAPPPWASAPPPVPGRAEVRGAAAHLPPPPGASPRWLPSPAAGWGVGRWLLELWVLGICAFSMTAAIAYTSEDLGAPQSGARLGLVVLAWVGGLGACVLLVLRRRYPVLVTVTAGLAALVLPIDSLAVLVALPWVIARRPARTGWWCGALAAAGTGVALLRDAMRGPEDALFSLVDQATGDSQMLPPAGYVVFGLLFLTVSAGWGLVRRSREAAARAAQGQHQQAQVARELRAELSTELTRQDERDLIARELHDTVAHHLSVVSLRASALEVTADVPDVRDAARSMRSSAHEALEEMRDLIAVLRDAQVPITPGPMPGRTLTDLPELLESAREGGADVTATVFVTDGGAAPATLTRAVYRVVQESLTNALKHAPGARVELDVRAAPGDGAHVRVRNRLAAPRAVPPAGFPVPPQDDSPAATGSGTGLVGMRERAATLGGTVEAGPDGDWWVVTAHLPWPAAAVGPGRGSTIGG